jgi:hypothetical protein
MIRPAILFAMLAINVSTTPPTLASQCASPSEIAATLTRWAAARRQFVQASNHDMACRALATTFYESVATRQATAACIHDAGGKAEINALDSEVDAFNDLLSSKCGS